MEKGVQSVYDPVTGVVGSTLWADRTALVPVLPAIRIKNIVA